MTNTPRAERISRREYVQRSARRAGLSRKTMQTAYDAMIGELVDLSRQGHHVTLTGFGKFYSQEHKGHRVVYGANGGSPEVPDYTVLKFSATRAVNRSLSGKDAAGK